MDELLTARQVQDLLKVDRTTVYRMLRDGRLTGVKIGQLWRFSRQEVDAFVTGIHLPEARDEKRDSTLCTQVLPMHCVQAIQDVFAEVAQVGCITTAPNGEPVTKISNSCRFCSLILSTNAGREGCIASWRRLAERPEQKPKFADCHAGLRHAYARIEVDGQFIATLIAGQFRTDLLGEVEEQRRIQRLADSCSLDPKALADAARELPALDERKRQQISGWLERVAQTFSDIGRERAELMNRLRRIAAISTIEQK